MKTGKEQLQHPLEINRIVDTLINELGPLRFRPPVSHVYNPLVYAKQSHDRYLDRYGQSPKEVVFIGMNPGPWGMAQTGVPFGEIESVRGWLGIEAAVGSPEKVHPKRPVQGFACTKREVSGKRLWGWAKQRFGTTDRFFSRFFVANYCPLLFMEAGGRNRTPDKLPKAERIPLMEICDRALCSTVRYFQPRYVIGVGSFAAKRAEIALKEMNVRVGRITHPSPANPLANRGWAERVEKELIKLGVALPELQ